MKAFFLHPALRRTLVIGLALFLLWYSFRGVDLEAIWQAMRATDHGLLMLAGLSMALAFGVRALRWRMLFGPNHPITYISVWQATMVCYLGNCYLPARAGEVMRIHLLGRATNISRNFLLGTVVVERASDVVMVAAACGVGVLFLPAAPLWLSSAAGAMTITACSILAVLLSMPWLGNRADRIVSLLRIPVAYRPQASKLLGTFLGGANALRLPSRFIAFNLLSPLYLLLDAMALVFLSEAMSLPLSLPQCLLVLGAIGLAMTLPSTPGGLGIFQMVAVTVLPPFGFMKPEALAYILVYQGLGYVVVTLFGVWSLWRLQDAAKQTAREPNLTSV
ncbi:MAG: flippase-like domain-containing protein [Magnetococcales bacterium]|nr:flippase-like domain-containing protein [Magnetococcales bacterium]